MELTAAIAALRWVPEGSSVRIISDSSYVTNLWGIKRIDRGERNEKNHDLWEALRDAIAVHRSVETQWVKGHSGVEGNERADLLADAGRLGNLMTAGRPPGGG
jgi:ribonuclease HI